MDRPGEQRHEHPHWIGWLAIPMQIVIVAVLSILYSLLGSSNPIVLGLITYIIAAIVLRIWMTRHLRRGDRLVRLGRYTEGAFAYQDGYELFNRYPWLDEFRLAFMLTHGRFCYREIALINEAHCRLWNDEVESAVSLYLRTTEEFPSNTIAWSAIKLFDGGVKHARRQATTTTTGTAQAAAPADGKPNASITIEAESVGPEGTRAFE
jgi:hypothetical protein